MRPWRKIRSLFRKTALDAEMAEEMRLHLELQTEKNLAAGMGSEEARYAARRMFGGMEQVKERCRDQRGWLWLEETLKDVCFAARSLAKAPGFTAAVVLSLAIGIGATTAIVALGRELAAVRPNFPEPERLVVLTGPDYGNLLNAAPYPMFGFPHRFVALEAGTKSYAALGTQRYDALNLVRDGEPTALTVQWVSAGFFPVLGVKAQLGRLFACEDFGALRDSVVVLSWDEWTTRFAADANVLGREILLGGRARRIVGVLPRDFGLPSVFGGVAPAYLPEVHAAAPVFMPFRWVQVFGRLRDGVSLGAARAEMTAFQFPGERVLEPRERARQMPRVVPLRAYYPAGFPGLFWLFFAAVGGFFAIACANAANLVLARTVGRSRELVVRLALGGGRWRIARLVFAETLLLAIAGGGLGLVVAWGTHAAMQAVVVTGARGEAATVFAPATVAATLGLSLLACVAAAGAPVGRIWRAELNDLLKDGFGSLGESRRLRRLRKGLVVAQAALAVALTIATVVMTRSFWRLYRTDLGFKTEHRLAVAGQLPEGVSEEKFLQLTEQVRERRAALPGVRSVTAASMLPLTNMSAQWNLRIVGRPDAGEIPFRVNRVSPEYFSTLGLSMVAGTGFQEVRPGDRRVAIINRTAALRYFPKRDAVGQWLDAEPVRKWEIIGVVSDVRESPRWEDVGPQLYAPLWQPPVQTQSLAELVLLEGKPTAQFQAAVRQAVYGIDPRIVLRLSALADTVNERNRAERDTMIILNLLGGLAVALAAFGLAAVMAYAVAQRTREFGVRVALGAEPGDLQRLVLREGTMLVALGVALGAAAAWGATPLLKALLFETGARDPVTFLVGPAALGCVALVACWLPARRAAKVDPIVALRCE